MLITYFNKYESTQLHKLCVSKASVEKLANVFTYADISLPPSSDLTTTNKTDLAQNLLKLENQIQSQHILMIPTQRHVYLYGRRDAVHQIEEEIKYIKKRCESTICKLNLECEQVK